MSQPVTYEEILQLFKETDAQFKETGAQFRETGARFRETDARFKETDRRMRELQNLFEGQWGKLMESLVEGDLVRILRERGIEVYETSMRVEVKRAGFNYEFDIIAHNGDEIVIVEVKTTLRVKQVSHFLDKLARAKEIFPRYVGNRIYGAVAYLREEESAARYAEKEGLLVIRATGNSAVITNAADFTPRIY